MNEAIETERKQIKSYLRLAEEIEGRAHKTLALISAGVPGFSRSDADADLRTALGLYRAAVDLLLNEQTRAINLKKRLEAAGK